MAGEKRGRDSLKGISLREESDQMITYSITYTYGDGDNFGTGKGDGQFYYGRNGDGMGHGLRHGGPNGDIYDEGRVEWDFSGRLLEQ